MKIVIVGCGRVGSTLAENLDAEGHEVIIFDVKTAAFDRLPETFKGAAIRGDGTDEEVLRRAGAYGADIFLSLTEGDNRNIMAAQLASEAFRVGQVIAKINDPLRALAYAELGIATICRTDLMANAILSYLKLPVSVVPGVRSSTGHHRHDPEVGPGGPAAGAGGDGAADLIAGLAEAGIPIRTLDASTPPPDAADPASVPGSAASSGSVKLEG